MLIKCTVPAIGNLTGHNASVEDLHITHRINLKLRTITITLSHNDGAHEDFNGTDVCQWNFALWSKGGNHIRIIATTGILPSKNRYTGIIAIHRPCLSFGTSRARVGVLLH